MPIKRLSASRSRLAVTALLALLVLVSAGCLDTGIRPTLPVPPPFVPPGQQGSTPQGAPSPTTASPDADGSANTSGAIDVYFTNPGAPGAKDFRGGPDEELAAAIDQARLSVDMAIYDLNLWSIRDALLAAARRGVAVRVVTESDNLDESEIQEIKDAGIPVIADRREGFMHNKYTVIDRQDVWTGSMNYTTTDAYGNNNNLVHVRSSQVAADYTQEFNEMFEKDLFGPDKLSQTPNPVVKLNGTLLEIYFSPDDHTASRLIELVQDAQKSVYFLAYSYTSDDLAEAMLERYRAGVIVAGVFESSQVASNTGDEFDNLWQAGLDVRMDGNSRNMHDKVFIIDGQIVVTGSYNFSANAEKNNDENTLVIHNPDIAALFMAEYQRIFAKATAP